MSIHSLAYCSSQVSFALVLFLQVLRVVLVRYPTNATLIASSSINTDTAIIKIL
jgi:hypothetical protein